MLREEIMAKIDYWHTKMPAIGSRKIMILLQREGYGVGRKYVQNCMRQMGITAVYPKANLSKRNFKEAVVPYLLRNYPVQFPNQVWPVEITYIKMYHSHMYLTAVIDWYSRKIVGWNLSDTLDTVSALAAVKEAVATYGVPAILNSDQGSQFTSEEYKSYLKGQHIRQSMDGKSRWADNIMIERWFRTLKTEKIYSMNTTAPKSCGKIFRNSYRSTMMYARMRRWLILRRAHYLHPVLLLQRKADKKAGNVSAINLRETKPITWHCHVHDKFLKAGLDKGAIIKWASKCSSSLTKARFLGRNA